MKIPGRRPPIPEGEPIEPFVLPEPPNPNFYDPAWDAWKPKRTIPAKYIVLGLAVAIVLIGSVYLVKSLTATTPKRAAAPVVTPTPTTFNIPAEPNAPAPTIFAGTKKTTTASFSVPAGLAVMTATCECIGTNFEVHLINGFGATVATPINTLGSGRTGLFSGSVPLGVGSGTYSLAVKASGRWTVKIAYPPTTQPVLSTSTQRFGATGPAVIGPFPSNQAFGVLLALGGEQSPVTLSLIYNDGSAGPTIMQAATTTPAIGKSVAAQPKSFYFVVSDNSNGFGLIVKGR